MDINLDSESKRTMGLSILHDDFPKIESVHCIDKGNVSTFGLQSCQSETVASTTSHTSNNWTKTQTASTNDPTMNNPPPRPFFNYDNTNCIPISRPPYLPFIPAVPPFPPMAMLPPQPFVSFPPFANPYNTHLYYSYFGNPHMPYFNPVAFNEFLNYISFNSLPLQTQQLMYAEFLKYISPSNHMNTSSINLCNMSSTNSTNNLDSTDSLLPRSDLQTEPQPQTRYSKEGQAKRVYSTATNEETVNKCVHDVPRKFRKTDVNGFVKRQRVKNVNVNHLMVKSGKSRDTNDRIPLYKNNGCNHKVEVIEIDDELSCDEGIQQFVDSIVGKDYSCFDAKPNKHLDNIDNGSIASYTADMRNTGQDGRVNSEVDTASGTANIDSEKKNSETDSIDETSSDLVVSNGRVGLKNDQLIPYSSKTFSMDKGKHLSSLLPPNLGIHFKNIKNRNFLLKDHKLISRNYNLTLSTYGERSRFPSFSDLLELTIDENTFNSIINHPNMRIDPTGYLMYHVDSPQKECSVTDIVCKQEPDLGESFDEEINADTAENITEEELITPRCDEEKNKLTISLGPYCDESRLGTPKFQIKRERLEMLRRAVLPALMSKKWAHQIKIKSSTVSSVDESP